MVDVLFSEFMAGEGGKTAGVLVDISAVVGGGDAAEPGEDCVAGVGAVGGEGRLAGGVGDTKV